MEVYLADIEAWLGWAVEPDLRVMLIRQVARIDQYLAGDITRLGMIEVMRLPIVRAMGVLP